MSPVITLLNFYFLLLNFYRFCLNMPTVRKLILRSFIKHIKYQIKISRKKNSYKLKLLIERPK